MAKLPFILFFVWAAAMLLTIWAVEVARMFARRAAKAKDATYPLPENPPAVAIILPIKGAEEDTAENLRALLRLSYPTLRYLFSVESEADPVIPLLQELTRGLPADKFEIVIAGMATKRGQKIHNQLAAVARTTPTDEILVFMDADARPNDRWLPALVSLLDSPDIGASTGYRLYVPALNQSSAHMASAMVSVINAMIAALLGPPSRNHAWGGSMAITRKNFFDLGVKGAWQNSLSDDYALSRQLKGLHKKEIRFRHSCFVASTANFNWHSFFEFAPRQYKITKVCSHGLWLLAISGSILYAVAFAYPLILWVIDLVIGRPDHRLLLMFTALYIANMIRGLFLLKGSKAALPEHAGQLQAVAFWYTWGFPLALFANLLALLKSARGRTVQWRGITYTMLSPTHTLVHRQGMPDSSAPAAGATPQLLAK